MSRKNIPRYADEASWRINRRRSKRKYYDRTKGRGDGHHYLPWEDEIIMKHEMTDTEIANKLNRSVGSIQGRRGRLRKQERINQTS